MLNNYKECKFPTQILLLFYILASITCLEVDIIRGEGNVEKQIVSNNTSLNLHRSDFPLLLTCCNNQQTQWEIKTPCVLESSECLPELGFKVDRSLRTESVIGDGLYISALNITNYTPQVIGSYTCKSPSASLTIGLSLKQDTKERSSFLHPGSNHVVMPVLGEPLIVLPCHLYSSSGDVEVEKISSWTTRKIDLEYDPLLSSFVIRLPTGSYEEIKHYVGTYRFSQIGFDSKTDVTVEVLSPSSHLYHPMTEILRVRKGDLIRLSCSSKTPITLVRDGYNIGYRTRYDFQPKENLKYKSTLTYTASVAESGEFKCVTETGEVIHTWEYEFKDITLTNNGEEIVLRTPTGQENTSPKFTISVCHNYATCKLLKETWRDKIPNTNHQSCGDGCYSVKPEIKSPFLLKYEDAPSGTIGSLIFFWDIEGKLVELRDEDIYSLDSMITMNYKNLESGVNKITCDWIPFFLGDDVEWYLDGERMQEDMMEIDRQQSGMGISSTIKISGKSSIYKNSQLNVTCVPSIWEKVKIFPSFRNGVTLSLPRINEDTKSKTSCENVEAGISKKKEEPATMKTGKDGENWRNELSTLLVISCILLFINIITTTFDVLSRRQFQLVKRSERKTVYLNKTDKKGKVAVVENSRKQSNVFSDSEGESDQSRGLNGMNVGVAKKIR